MPKPDRKAHHKGRICCLVQNKVDFESQEKHQEKAHESFEKGGLGASNSIIERPIGKDGNKKLCDEKQEIKVPKFKKRFNVLV